MARKPHRTWFSASPYDLIWTAVRGARASPPDSGGEWAELSWKRGGGDTRKISRSLLCGADGVVTKFQQKLLVFTHHPVCAS